MKRVVGPVKLTEAEYIAESYAVVQAMYGRKVKWNYLIAVLAAGLGGLCLAVAPSQLIQTLGGIYLFMAVILFGIAVYWPYSVRGQATKIARNPLNRSFFVEASYEFCEDGIASETANGTTSYVPYSCIVQAKRSPNALILNPSQLHFFFLPLRLIDDELLAFLAEKMKVNGIII